MLVTMTRTKENHLSTLGSFLIDGKSAGVLCLEDGKRVPKIHGETRIPAGTYKLTLRTEGNVNEKYLERFGPAFHHGMLWLRNIPEFEFVYVHCGNFVTQTEGCLLTGRGFNPPADATKPYSVTDSETAYRKLYPPIAAAILAGADVRITVAEAFTKPDPLVA